MEAHIVWIVFIKAVFILIVLLGIVMPNSMLIRYKDKIETIFFVSMAILLLYLFNPRGGHIPTKEERYLLFLFGIVILATTKWQELII